MGQIHRQLSPSSRSSPSPHFPPSSQFDGQVQLQLNNTTVQLRSNLTDMMKNFNHVSAFVILVMTVFWSPGQGIQVSQCRGVDIDMAEDHLMHINECLKDAGVKEVKDIEPEKMPCFGKCVFSKKGLIDDKGKPHKEKIMNMIVDKMPKVVHDDLNKRVATCLLPNSTDLIDPADASCTTYLPTLMCIHASFLEECA